MNNCKTCTNAACEECFNGFRLSAGECIACATNLHHCKACKSANVCDQCDSNVAGVDINGKCSKCRTDNGWQWSQGNNKCVCNDIVNVNDGNKCLKCNDLIPGCTKCEYTDNPGDELAVEVGFDPDISAVHGTFAGKKGNFVKCTNAASGLIKVKIRK